MKTVCKIRLNGEYEMKILHLMLANFYIDNYSYQENMLPKFHKKQGHEVKIIASLFIFDENGKGKWIDKGSKYVNEHGINVTRLEFKNPSIDRRMRRYKELYEEIDRFNPDIIFIHGVQFWDIKVIRKYLKEHPNVRVFADNHADFINSGKTIVSKYILHRIIWRHCAQIINPYVTKFYGVLPARVDFLINEYKLPKEKVELLIMGADDEKVTAVFDSDSRERIRQKYDIGKDKFLVITGGKIDSNKPETLDLIKAAIECRNENVHLMVFGSVVPELKEEFDYLTNNNKITYVGWVNSDDIYEYFASADLAFFPGKHSVLWEQAVGTGLPCVFRRMSGFTHVDIGGNCIFTDDLSRENMTKILEDISYDETLYQDMKDICLKKGMSSFSYDEIAKRSII